VEKVYVEEVFDKFSEITVLVIGDAMVDNYLWGRVDRISPEAPVPIVTVTKQEDRLGGAANVSMNLQALGLPFVCIIIGNDGNWESFSENVRRKNGDEGIIIVQAETTMKNRMFCGHRNRDRQEDSDLILNQLKAGLGYLPAIIANRILILGFCDYDKVD
jgi:bifunctional ADP-heptose synthase (sugar kinase/adenylyltransferase)